MAIISLPFFVLGLILGMIVIGPILVAIIKNTGSIGFMLIIILLLIILYISILGLQGGKAWES